MVDFLTPDFQFTDERGTLVQLVREGYKQVNVVRSKAGAFRGGHCHRLNKEAFYVVEGSIELTVRKEGVEKNFHFFSGDMFAIHPMVYHDFLFHSDTILIGMYDKGVELPNGEKDIIAEI